MNALLLELEYEQMNPLQKDNIYPAKKRGGS